MFTIHRLASGKAANDTMPRAGLAVSGEIACLCHDNVSQTETTTDAPCSSAWLRVTWHEYLTDTWAGKTKNKTRVYCPKKLQNKCYTGDLYCGQPPGGDSYQATTLLGTQLLFFLWGFIIEDRVAMRKLLLPFEKPDACWLSRLDRSRCRGFKEMHTDPPSHRRDGQQQEHNTEQQEAVSACSASRLYLVM